MWAIFASFITSVQGELDGFNSSVIIHTQTQWSRNTNSAKLFSIARLSFEILYGTLIAKTSYY